MGRARAVPVEGYFRDIGTADAYRRAREEWPARAASMIITQTPLRIGLLGGGTDLPGYYREHGGRVLNCALDKYVYVIVKQRFDDDIYVNYSKKEIVSRVEDLEHELVREAMQMTGVTNGVEITTLADIPSAGGSGLGSSSAVTVGLLHALFAYQGRQVSAEELADRACTIEIEHCGKPIGKQDQYIAAFGGIRDIRFGPGDEVVPEELALPAADRRALQQQIMLFYTGITRSATPILAEQNANVEATRAQLDLLRDLAGFAVERLRGGDVDAIGPALRESWEAKRKLASGVSNDQIDQAVTPSARRGRIGRQADWCRRWRLPARHLPAGAAARRAREPGEHARTAGEAGPPRLARRAQRAARHLGLTCRPPHRDHHLLEERRYDVKIPRRARGTTSSDAATVRWRRYVETSVKASSVNEASRQYVTMNRASARRTPGGWKKAVTNRNARIMAQTTTPKSPSCM